MAEGTFLTALGAEAYEGFGHVEDTSTAQVRSTPGSHSNSTLHLFVNICAMSIAEYRTL